MDTDGCFPWPHKRGEYWIGCRRCGLGIWLQKEHIRPIIIRLFGSKLPTIALFCKKFVGRRLADAFGVHRTLASEQRSRDRSKYLVPGAQMLLSDEGCAARRRSGEIMRAATNFLDVLFALGVAALSLAGLGARGRQRRHRRRRAEGNQKRDAPVARGAQARSRSDPLARESRSSNSRRKIQKVETTTQQLQNTDQKLKETTLELQQTNVQVKTLQTKVDAPIASPQFGDAVRSLPRIAHLHRNRRGRRPIHLRPAKRRARRPSSCVAELVLFRLGADDPVPPDRLDPVPGRVQRGLWRQRDGNRSVHRRLSDLPQQIYDGRRPACSINRSATGTRTRARCG